MAASCASCTAVWIEFATAATGARIAELEGGEGAFDFFFALFFDFDTCIGGRIPSFMRCLRRERNPGS